MQFKKKQLQAMVKTSSNYPLELIKEDVVSEDDAGYGMAYTTKEFIFEDHQSGKLYRVLGSKGFMESWFELEDDMIECDEVVPVEKIVTVYEAV